MLLLQPQLLLRQQPAAAPVVLQQQVARQQVGVRSGGSAPLLLNLPLGGRVQRGAPVRQGRGAEEGGAMHRATTAVLELQEAAEGEGRGVQGEV